MATLTTERGLELRTKVPEPYFAEERAGWKGYIEWEVRMLFAYIHV